MIGNSVAGRVAAYINRCDKDPSLIAAEHVVYKCALSDQGANINHIIDAAIRDDWVMRNAVRLTHSKEN